LLLLLVVVQASNTWFNDGSDLGEGMFNHSFYEEEKQRVVTYLTFWGV